MAPTKITSNVIEADAVTGAKIADDAIDSEHYTDGSIDTAHIAADAITGAKIADDQIDSEHYVAGSIDNEHLADDAIDSEHYAAGSIDTAHIADDQVTLAKMAGITRGSIIIGNSSGDPAALAIGTNDHVLTSDGTDIAWEATSGGTIASASDCTVSSSDPTITTNPSAVGHFWVNKTSGECYICTDVTTGSNTWTNIGDGTGHIATNYFGDGSDGALDTTP
jgi:hypothetical protein